MPRIFPDGNFVPLQRSNYLPRSLSRAFHPSLSCLCYISRIIPPWPVSLIKRVLLTKSLTSAARSPAQQQQKQKQQQELKFLGGEGGNETLLDNRKLIRARNRNWAIPRSSSPEVVEKCGMPRILSISRERFDDWNVREIVGQIAGPIFCQ